MCAKWSTNYDKCIVCGTTSKKHKAKGMCTLCYSMEANRQLGKAQLFTCIQCGKKFSPEYYCSRPRKFCTHKCSEDYQVGKRRGPIRTKEEVLEKMRSAILSADTYLDKPKLLRAAKICSETFSKLGLYIVDIYYGMPIYKKQFVEEQSYYILKQYIQDLEFSKVFADCISPRGYKLRFDMYSSTYRMIIEVDGEHHKYKSSQEYLKYFLECDSYKDTYAVSKGFSIYRIPIKRKTKITLEHIKKYLPPEIFRNNARQDNQQPSFVSDDVEGSTTSRKA